MKSNCYYPYLVFLFFLSSCHSQKTNSDFRFKHNKQGIELVENNKPVFFYQEQPKSLDGKYICNNYVHPLYNLDGDILTEEFPKDHPYHRGIFWAWHQIYANGESLGDGWIMENIKQRINHVKTSVKDNIGILDTDVFWESLIFNHSKPFLKEHTKIMVYPTEDGNRIIDFAISLKALVPGLEIGGSDDKKGYGGFCARLKLPKDLTFTSDSGPVTPKVEQVRAGPWMDFSGSIGRSGKKNGISILCHPKTPNYPAPWILRSEASMQNIVFPGNQKIEIPMDKGITLYYRLVIHNGGATSINFNKLQKDYEETPVVYE